MINSFAGCISTSKQFVNFNIHSEFPNILLLQITFTIPLTVYKIGKSVRGCVILTPFDFLL